MYWFSFVFVFNQLTLSLFSKICHRTFVSNSLHPDLVPFREFRFVYGLFLCTTIPPATPCVVSYLLQPALISSAPVASDLFPPPPMCVLQLLFVLFWSFFCVSSCYPTHYTYTHLYTRIRIHTHNYLTPSTSLPLTHTIHSSPHPCLSRARTSAPIHVISCLLSVSPVFQCTVAPITYPFSTIYIHLHPFLESMLPSVHHPRFCLI